MMSKQGAYPKKKTNNANGNVYCTWKKKKENIECD